MAIFLICITWVITVLLLKHKIPEWAANEVMLLRVMMYTQENRIETLESQGKLSEEVRRFRKAMRPFVKSQACKIYVGKRGK